MKQLLFSRSSALVLLVVAGLGAVNLVAYLQARSMTHYSSSGTRTERPEGLGVLARLGVILTGVNIPRPFNAVTPAALDLPFDTILLPAREGVTLEAWVIPAGGTKPVILAFHGYAASKAALLSAARVFHELGHDLMLIDFYGSGGSSGSDTSLGFREAEDVAAALLFARKKWPGRQVVLYGFSMATVAILRAIAVEHAEPDAIILEGAFDDLLTTAKNRFQMMGLPGTPFAELLLFWGGRQWDFDPFAHDSVEYARSVRCPTLMLHGGDDVRTTPPQARRVAGVIAGARFLVYPGVPHMPIVEERPIEWRRDIGEMLDSIPATDGGN